MDPGESPFEQLATDPVAAESTRSAVETAQYLLSRASPEDRTLLTLLYLVDMSLAEIADHFGWSLANAKIKAYRARNRLKGILKDHDYQFD